MHPPPCNAGPGTTLGTPSCALRLGILCISLTLALAGGSAGEILVAVLVLLPVLLGSILWAGGASCPCSSQRRQVLYKVSGEPKNRELITPSLLLLP